MSWGWRSESSMFFLSSKCVFPSARVSHRLQEMDTGTSTPAPETHWLEKSV